MTSSRARHGLARRLAAIGPPTTFTPPAAGWIKAVRQALGMTSVQLARRLGVRPPTLSGIEQSEGRGTIQLSTLERVAAALDCTVVYALVPNTSLRETVERRARAVARRQLEAVAHTMRLEDQGVPEDHIEEQIDEIAAELNPRKLWDDV